MVDRTRGIVLEWVDRGGGVKKKGNGRGLTESERGERGGTGGVGGGGGGERRGGGGGRIGDTRGQRLGWRDVESRWTGTQRGTLRRRGWHRSSGKSKEAQSVRRRVSEAVENRVTAGNCSDQASRRQPMAARIRPHGYE